ncbi:MAG: precorrin-2 C(20)-methyltransferase, partial [Chloroflexota bacterium]
ILLKVGPVFPQIRSALIELDLLENAVYAERVGMPEEHTVQGLNINSLSNERQPYLSLMIVKKGS